MISDRFVIVDTETTDLTPWARGRIIEVACVVVENGTIVANYETLISPGFALSGYTTYLTGITDGMLYGQPRFHEVASELFSLFQDAVFVAHNASFDQRFLQAEFGWCGLHFSPRTMCTVQLSRRLFPQYRTHKLADLIERFELPFEKRHRAGDDAAALWHFLNRAQREFGPEKLSTAMSQLIKS